VSEGLASALPHRQIRRNCSEFGVVYVAKKKAGIEAGDKLVMELPVAATWPDGKVTHPSMARGSPSPRTILKSARY
jgi:hypothetical protein